MKTKVLVVIFLAILLVSCAPSNHFVIYSASSDEKSVNLYLVNTVSGENQQLTDVQYANYPSWSPDGKKIVFSSHDGLYFLNIGNKADLAKVVDTANFEISPIWSPDGSRIAFISQSQNADASSRYDLMVVNVDGTGLITIASNLGENDYFHSFSWSPDGKQLTFSQQFKENRQIVVVNANGTELTRITDLTTPTYSPPIQPSWSPDGERIAFVTFDLFVLNSDGTGLKKLVDRESKGFSTLASPQWSPNGEYIACQNGDDIVLVDSTNGQITTISEEFPISGYSWAPRGDELAYFVYPGQGTLNIETINLNSMKKTQITKGLGFYPWQSLSWQP